MKNKAKGTIVNTKQLQTNNMLTNYLQTNDSNYN